MDSFKIGIKELSLKRSNENIIFEATVPTGLENLAIQEIVKKDISSKENTCFTQGRIYFLTSVLKFKNVIKLRSIDNIHLFIDFFPDVNFTGTLEVDDAKIISFVNIVDFESQIKNWARLVNYEGNLFPTQKEHDEARIIQDRKFQSVIKGELDNYNNDDFKHNILKYRVTCERTGKKHSFSSNEAAYKFGGELNNKFKWIVALSDWDLNVILRIQEDNIMVCLKITKKSLHHRNLISYGPTTLRPTIAYGMLSLADIKPGEHVLDPLCGSGSIPIECIYAIKNVIISCGDVNFRAIDRTLINMEAQITKKPKPDIFKWDATKLPIKDHQIDAIITDLPFGKRSGSKSLNSVLYKQLLNEFFRVLRKETGRIVLLTQDLPHLYKALFQQHKKNPSWSIKQMFTVNVGSLKCNMVLAKPNYNCSER